MQFWDGVWANPNRFRQSSGAVVSIPVVRTWQSLCPESFAPALLFACSRPKTEVETASQLHAPIDFDDSNAQSRGRGAFADTAFTAPDNSMPKRRQVPVALSGFRANALNSRQGTDFEDPNAQSRGRGALPARSLLWGWGDWDP